MKSSILFLVFCLSIALFNPLPMEAAAKSNATIINPGIGKVKTIDVYIENAEKDFFKNTKIIKNIQLNKTKVKFGKITWTGTASNSVVKISISTVSLKEKDKLTVYFNHKTLKQTAVNSVTKKENEISSINVNGKGDFIKIKNISLKDRSVLYFQQSFKIKIDYTYGLFSQNTAMVDWEMGTIDEQKFAHSATGTRISGFAETQLKKGVHSGTAIIELSTSDVENLLQHFFPGEIIIYAHSNKDGVMNQNLLDFPIRTHVYVTEQEDPSKNQ